MTSKDNSNNVHNVNNNHNKINPKQITGLKQAVFVLNCLTSGMGESRIIELFQGDKQLVELWISFMLHNKWVVNHHGSISKWEVTQKGKEMMLKYML